MSKSLRSRAVLAMAVLLAACGDDYDATRQHDLPVTVADGVLSAVVPEEGGALVGPADGPFAGLRVDFPAGAVPADTLVTVVPGSETDPLPELAERVGAQFSFGPGDLVLAAPVDLTLPVRTASLGQLGAGAEDVRVWIRDGDTWSLQTTTASSVESVTIQVGALTTAAAGVKLPFLEALCLTCGSTCPATGACVEDLGVLPVPPSLSTFAGYRITGKGSTIAYVGSQGGADVGVKITLPAVGSGGSISSSISQPAVGASACCLTVPFLDDDGSLRVARTIDGAGFTRFRFGATTQLEGTGVAGVPVGLVRAADGRVARVTRKGVLDPAGNFRSFPLVNRIDSDYWLAPDFDRPSGFISASNGTVSRLRRYGLDGSAEDSASIPGVLDSCFSSLTADRADGGGTNVVCASGHYDVLLRFVPTGLARCNFPFSLAGPTCESYFTASTLQFFDVDYDATGGLWLTSALTPEVLYLTPSKVLTSQNLQAKLPNVPASQLLPRDVVVLSDTTAVVVTSTNRVIRVRRD